MWRPATSDQNVDDAFHDHVVLGDAIASGNERVAESVMYAHIERDRLPSFAALGQPVGVVSPPT